MTLDQFLKSDMATIVAAARSGFAWWIDELRELLPGALMRSRDPVLTIDAAGQLADPSRSGRSRLPTRAAVLIPSSFVLKRTIEVPAMSRGDLIRMVQLDSERYLPLPADAALIAADVVGRGDDNGTIIAAVSALPLSDATTIAAALDRAGVTPASIRVAGAADVAGDRVDFVPALRRAGLLVPARDAAAAWWSLAAFAFALNVGLIVWRDSASVEQLQSLVDSQQPAVDIARRITAQMRRADVLATRAAFRREGRDALGDLTTVTTTVPDGAWVQRYVWEDRAIRLTGYRSHDADVAAALRRVPRFVSVKSAQNEALAEITAGEPFDLAITVADR